jgi:hypothetical protein
MFVSDSLNPEIPWITPKGFFVHACPQPPNVENLKKITDDLFIKKLNETKATFSPAQNKVYNLVIKKKKNVVFLSPAGTGKSYVGRVLKTDVSINKGSEYVLVVSPTHNSAAVIGGTTIHGTFHFGHEEYEIYQLIHNCMENPGNIKHFVQQFILTNNKSFRRLRIIGLIIIDEFGRVRRDFFDAIHLIMVEVHQNDKLMGGCQVVLLGDPAQAPYDRSDEYKEKIRLRHNIKDITDVSKEHGYFANGFGFCFESDLFIQNNDFGTFEWVVINNVDTFRFITTSTLNQIAFRASGRDNHVIQTGKYSILVIFKTPNTVNYNNYIIMVTSFYLIL